MRLGPVTETDSPDVELIASYHAIHPPMGRNNAAVTNVARSGATVRPFRTRCAQASSPSRAITPSMRLTQHNFSLT